MIIEGESIFSSAWELRSKVWGTIGSTRISVCGSTLVRGGRVAGRGQTTSPSERLALQRRGGETIERAVAERAAGCGHHRDGD